MNVKCKFELLYVFKVKTIKIILDHYYFGIAAQSNQLIQRNAWIYLWIYTIFGYHMHNI